MYRKSKRLYLISTCYTVWHSRAFINFKIISFIKIYTFFSQSFDYTELCQPIGMESGPIPVSVTGIQRTAVSVHGGQNSPTTSISSNPASTRSSRPWHDFGRQNDADKIQIPKMWVSFNFFFDLLNLEAR